jgi:hypothetical protein
MSYAAALRLRLPGRAIDVIWDVAELDRSNRPKAGAGVHKDIATKRTFATCGKLQ